MYPYYDRLIPTFIPGLALNPEEQFMRLIQPIDHPLMDMSRVYPKSLLD